MKRVWVPVVFILSLFFSTDAFFSINVLNGMTLSLMGGASGVFVAVTVYFIIVARKRKTQKRNNLFLDDEQSSEVRLIGHIFFGVLVRTAGAHLFNENHNQHNQKVERIQAIVLEHKQKITRNQPVKYLRLDSSHGKLNFKLSKPKLLPMGSKVTVAIKTGALGFDYIESVELIEK